MHCAQIQHPDVRIERLTVDGRVAGRAATTAAARSGLTAAAAVTTLKRCDDRVSAFAGAAFALLVSLLGILLGILLHTPQASRDQATERTHHACKQHDIWSTHLGTLLIRELQYSHASTRSRRTGRHELRAALTPLRGVARGSEGTGEHAPRTHASENSLPSNQRGRNIAPAPPAAHQICWQSAAIPGRCPAAGEHARARALPP
jgi:hypothetical protein